MGTAVTMSRFQFAFTPHITICSRSSRWGWRCSSCSSRRWRFGAATSAISRRRASGPRSSRINFAVGVVTGIPMEFQFGTNWAALLATTPAASSARRWRWRACSPSSRSRRSSGSSSSARSAFGPRVHWLSRRSWSASAPGCPASSSSPPTPGCSIPGRLSLVGAHGELRLSFWAFLFNPWVARQYLHNMSGAVDHRRLRAGGAGRLLPARWRAASSIGRLFLRVGVIVAADLLRPLSSSPPATGRASGRAAPAGDAGGDGGAVQDRAGAPLAIIGQPDAEHAARSTTRSRARACSAS